MKIQRNCRRLGFGAVALVAAMFSPAQEPASGVARFSFSVMGTDRMRDVGFAMLKPEARSKPRPVAADFEIIPLRVSSQGRSDLYAFEGPLPLRFVATAKDGESLRATKMLASVSEQLPAEALILLSPQAGADGELDLQVLDDTSAAFPARHVRIVNLSGRIVAGQLDDRRFSTDPGGAVIPPQSVGNSFRLGVAYERMGRPVVVFDQSLRLGADERVLLVFLPPFREGADVRVRVVRDSVHGGEEAGDDS